MSTFVINTAVPVDMTPPIAFLKGGVSLWTYSVPFFTTNVPLSYAAKYFKLFEELPQADTGEWTLEELFQRDISWDRVDTEILEYLKNPTRPQFFNALTVALLPANSPSLGGEFGDDVPMDPIPEPGLGKPLQIGGVQIQYYGSDVDVSNGAGRFRWATDHIDAVAVDGQHRLAAIKQFVSQTKSSVWGEAVVPVIFLIPDERVGFKTPHAAQERSRTVSALRSVFIDLNKNAKPVSAARTVLLDDLDIVSVATRSLIGRSLGETTEPERIPLPLVDWLTDRNKIEDGPFFTTVGLLNEALKRLLEAPDLLMDEEDNSVGKVETWIQQILPIPDKVALAEVMSRVRECARLQTRLSWHPAHIKTLETSFENEWRRHFRSLFLEYKPYADLWKYAQDKRLLGPEFVNLYVAQEVMSASAGQARAKRLIEAAKKNGEGWTVERRYDLPLAHINKTLKSENWAYKVVFQRALLRAYTSVLKAPEKFFGIGTTRDQAQSYFIKAMNKLEKQGLGKVAAPLKGDQRFWHGSGLTADNNVEFANAGAERIRVLLETFIILTSLGTASPTFGRLSVNGTESPAKLVARHFEASPNRVLFKGMQKLATARGEDDIDDAAEQFLKGRYERLRSIALTA
ncbi:hypothetical protein D3C80_767220 [compost metagenome]